MNKDIISFEYFEEMTTNWNRIDLLRRCYDLCNEMVEKKQEIERLNKALLDIKEILKKEYEWNEDRYIDIVDIVNKALGSDKE